MKNLLRGTIIIKKNTYISQLIKIIKGTIIELKNNQEIKKYYQGAYLPLEYLNQISPSDFIVQELTNIIYIDSKDILNLLVLLQKEINNQKIQINLLLINDPIIKISRFIFYKYEEKQNITFYLETTITELSLYLKIKKREITEAFSLLISKNIITKQNKLIIIQNLEQLQFEAFKKDY